MSHDDPGALTRRSGLVSAVLLVVLLAATGLPQEQRQLVDDACVTCCEPRPLTALPGRVGDAPRAQSLDVRRRNERPRALPRTRRVDRRGLPPPRAPTA